MKECILLKSGEISLKGNNRPAFEDKLIKNAKGRLRSLGKFDFYKAQSAIYAEPLEECDLDEAFERMCKVFGFAGVSKSRIVEKDYEVIKHATVEYLATELQAAKTFRVTARRSDKKFKPDSMTLCYDLGEFILEQFPHLKVDLYTPELTVVVEVRDRAAYIHKSQCPGAGGMPVGCAGKAALLLSGGIDSPVAAYMMAKRGLTIQAFNFVSPPYTSERARLKVEELCKKIAPYCGRVRLACVPFTEIQLQIKDNCNEEYMILIMRRFMMEIASRLGQESGCSALVTGESLGQVASQTVHAMAVTGHGIELPIFRPLIGMDKEEIVTIARKIDTYETSILPYEDCCTVFTPRHPKTRPNIEEVLRQESALDREKLIKQAMGGTVFTTIE